MSRIDELIERLCPDGVEFRELGEVSCYAKERVSAASVPSYGYVGVNELLQDYRGRSYEERSPTEEKCIRFEAGDVLLGNIRPYLKKMWLADSNGGTNGDVLVIRIKDKSLVAPRFLWHCLAASDFTEYNIQNSKGAKMPRGDKRAIMQFRIPIPPMEVQEEIVRVLDSFAELEAELETELEVRRKQYAYYRDKLLNFAPRVSGRCRPVRWTTLGEIASINTGSKPTSVVSDGTYAYINAGTTPSGSTMEANTLGDTVTTPSRGQGGIGFVGYSKRDFWCGPLCYRIRAKTDAVLNRYLYYALQSNTRVILACMNEGGTPAVNKKDLIGIPIPIPPLAEQQRIVDILDKFDALTNDISAGLPAEIEARRKQYAYYRDKLLTFKEKVA